MSTRSVLVVDDEPDIRSLLQEILEDEGYDVSVAETASAAQKAVDEQRPDLVLLDIWMPDMDGVSLLKSWKLSGTLAFPVIMISGHGTVETAVEATRHGAVDFIEKPVSLAKLLLTVERAFAEVGQAAANDTQGAPTPALLPQLLGDSEFVVSLRDRLEEVSVRSNPVLLVGEQGSGRLLFAQNVHERSKSLEGRVPLRCRMMSTSRQDLTDVVKRNAFDATLAHQLTSETIVIAPLRSHPEDIPALLEGFVDWHVKHEGLPYRHFTLAAQNRLRNETQGNIGDLAKHVGMERTHLYRKLRSLDIDLDKVRDA